MNLPVHVIDDVNAIPYLGQSVVEKYPELKSWNLPSRNNIDDLKLRTYAGFYRPLRHIELQSIYPIVQGYENEKAGGVRLDFGDSLGLSHITTTLSYSPDSAQAMRDRFHFGLEAKYWDWMLSGVLQQSRLLRSIRTNESWPPRIRFDRREEEEPHSRFGSHARSDSSIWPAIPAWTGCPTIKT